MRYLPKMQQLRVFEEVVRQGSIRSAARTLSQSQPAISRALKELENTLQTELFLRGPTGITLTPSGQLFAVRTRFILQELQRAGEEIDCFRQQQQGRVAVGLCGFFSQTILAGVVEKFRQRYPQTDLTLKEGAIRSLLPLLDSGEIDFAAGPLPADLPQDRLQIQPLFSVPLRVVAGLHHPARQAKQLQQLRHEKWLQVEESSATTTRTDAQLAQFFSQLAQPALRTSSLLSAIALVERAGYLMLLPQPLAVRWQHCLAPLMLGELPCLQYGAIRSKHSTLTASARQLLNIVEEFSGRYQSAGAESHGDPVALPP